MLAPVQKTPRLPRRALHGVLLLDKPLGWSSNDALQKVKGMLRAEKAGHTGTLDPLATGLLPLCFGAATKFAQVSLDADKTYLATLQLGETREGGDREGAPIERKPVTATLAQISAACAAFTGTCMQTPPMQSALKVDGKPLYDYARKGQTVARTAREVTIHALEVEAWVPEAALLTLQVRCSKGTYVRTLAEDIGAHLGCGAHLAALHRSGSGALDVAGAVTIDALQAMSDAERLVRLLPPDALLAAWPAVRLPQDEAARFLSGLRRRWDGPDCAHVRVYGPEPRALLGSGHVQGGELIADRLLSPPEVAALLNSTLEYPTP